MSVKFKITPSDVLSITDKMSGKMKGMCSLSVSPSANPFCVAMHNSKDNNIICTKCYSFRFEKFYKNAHKSWAMNYDILTSIDLSKYRVPRVKNEYNSFRFNAHGELGNRRHYENYVVIAEHNPNITFTLFTKRLDIIRKGGIIRLKNLIHIYSNPTINAPLYDIPIGFNKVFTVYTDKNFCATKINCQRSCAECLMCYKKNNRTIKVNELLNRGMRDE
jgi:hypothetical protein